MKNLIAVAAAALCSLSLPAQAEEPEYLSPWSVRIAYDLSIPGKLKMEHGGNDDLFHNGNGFKVGVAYYAPIYRDIYFEPAFNIGYRSYKYKDLMLGIDGNAVSFDPAIRKWGISIPLHIGYRFSIPGRNSSFRVFTGPELQYDFSARLAIDGQTAADNEIESDLFKDNGILPMQRMNCAWDIGAGFDRDNFYVLITGSFGLTNVINSDTDNSLKENHVDVSLGYNF